MSKYFSGIVVSVGCAHLLAKGIGRWRAGLDRLLVVTSPTDEQTLAVCREHGAEVHTTDVFWANGAKFNKGAAMSEAELCCGLRADHPEGWIVNFDADIVPPADWRDTLDRLLKPRCLHGCFRWELPEDATVFEIPPGQLRMPQSWIIGFFSCFQADDPVLTPDEPVWPLTYPHAGMYDTALTRKWHPVHRRIIPELRMMHLGRERENWCGYRPDQKALTASLLRDPNWHRERIEPPRIRRRGDRTPERDHAA